MIVKDKEEDDEQMIILGSICLKIKNDVCFQRIFEYRVFIANFTRFEVKSSQVKITEVKISQLKSSQYKTRLEK